MRIAAKPQVVTSALGLFRKNATRLGIAGAAAALALTASAGAADASTSASYIGYGYTEAGTPVWCVQHLLNHNGVYTAGIAEDGYWGPRTFIAVRAFQERLVDTGTAPHEQIDGIVGPDTGFWLLHFANQGDISNDPCYPYLPTSY
jgi:hypothetical protein